MTVNQPVTGASFLQVAVGAPRTPSPSVTATFPGSQTLGNLNILVVGWNDTVSSVTSVKDSNLNQYILAVGPTTGTGVRQSIYYAKNIAAGSNTVTVNFDKPPVFADVRALEYSGLDAVNPLDLPGTAGGVGTGSSANSGSATTSTANDMIFGAGTTSGHFNAAGTGFTSRIITSPNGDIAEDKTVSSTGSYNATAPASYSNWVMQMAAFRLAGQGGTGNPAPTVSSILPVSGTTAGGTPVTIGGTGFLPGATVMIGGNFATSVNVMNSGTITAVTPAHAAGAVNVVVTNSDSQIGTLPNGYTYTVTGAGAISFVQVSAATPQTPSASVSVTYPVAQTAGNLNIVVVGWNDTTSTVTGVNDSNLNPYNLAIGPTSGTGVRQSIYYAKSIAGGNNTVTVTFSKAAVYVDVRALEYAGLDPTNPLDTSAKAGASGASSSPNSGSVTTTSASELIFGAGTTSGHFNGPGTGFTSRIITSPDADIAEDKTVISTGSYNATAPASFSFWVMQVVGFRAAP